MSEVSSVYDALITRIETLLPNHFRLSNPYKIEENPETFLRIGYGLAIRGGLNSKRLLCGQSSTLRTFSVFIARRYASLESNAIAKATTEKQIMEDVRTLVADFETNTTLTNASRIVQFESDSGINYVQSESDRFMYCECLIEVEYFDTI